MSKAIQTTENAIIQARAAARRGALAEAERWSRVAERLAAAEAERDGIEQVDLDSWGDEEAQSAELRRRLKLYCEAVVEFRIWKEERDAYYETLHAAIANNLEPPPPLRPHPAGGVSEEAYLQRITLEGRVD
jgi:hypothetical protein